VSQVWARLINIKSLSETGLQVLTFFVVVFMTYCSYTTLFRLEIMTFYRLVPHGLSDPNSLLFSAAYLARLFYPLCYNILFVVRYANEAGSTNKTAFVQFMGAIDQVPVFGHWYFQLVFPITVLLVVFIVAADFHKRIIACFTDVFEQEEDFEHASIKEGKELLQRERTARLSVSGVPHDGNRVVPTSPVAGRLRAGPVSTCAFPPP
jgi:hypothetical protein